ncbi:MAG: nucleotide sugar dehydrogenase [Chlorobi bacterium]|nr:nucleotide sugar dehydrogenase [Chlorobiota bacterium]
MNLLDRINARQFNVAVVGLGYVGLPLAVEFAKAGITTHGIDVDPRKVESLAAGKNYIQDISDDLVADVIGRGLLSATSDFSVVADADVIYICVPTPFTPNKEPDISYILQAAESIAKHLRGGQCIILKSTTFPNTTEGYVQPILERDGKKVGIDFHLAFSPERIDPGNKTWHTTNTPIVVGGVTRECTVVAAAANRVIIEKVIEVSGPKVAEMEKLLENIFRSVNIALVNELAQLCDRMGGVNIWEVVEAAATKPFGFMPFFPGPGIGGHCILIDPYYLSWLAREHDFVTNFITLAAEVNESMPYYVQRMVLQHIAHLPVALKDAKILVFGVAFKRDVDDLRHSPALKVMELLTQDGAGRINYIDPFIPKIEIFGKTMNALDYSDELVAEADLVLITTDHTLFDYERIVANAKVVIDTRNATRKVAAGREKIHLLGDGQCIR